MDGAESLRGLTAQERSMVLGRHCLKDQRWELRLQRKFGNSAQRVLPKSSTQGADPLQASPLPLSHPALLPGMIVLRISHHDLHTQPLSH